MRSKDDEGEDWAAVHYGKLDYIEASSISLIYLPGFVQHFFTHTEQTERGGADRKGAIRR